MRGRIALVAGIIVLLLVNWSILGKERLLSEGKIVYLHLAPVDPRSLMQGDYMALRFAIENDLYKALPKVEQKRYRGWRRNLENSDGRVVVKLDDKGIATFSRLEDGQPLANDEIYMRYRIRDGALKFATNAYFFQEGHAKDYTTAQYGQFRVDKNGELLLTAMYDKDLIKLGPPGQN
jgi:uncharacterized membrane-anchored protein